MNLNILGIFVLQYVVVFRIIKFILQTFSFQRRLAKAIYFGFVLTILSFAVYLYSTSYREKNLFEYFSLKRSFTNAELSTSYKKIIQSFRERERLSQGETAFMENLKEFYDLLSNQVRRTAYDKYNEVNKDVIYTKYYDYFRIFIETFIYIKFFLLGYLITAQENVRNARKYIFTIIISFFLMEIHYYVRSPYMIQKNSDIYDSYLPHLSIFDRINIARVCLIILLNSITFYHAIFLDNKEKTAVDNIRSFIGNHYGFMKVFEGKYPEVYEKSVQVLDSLEEVKQKMDIIFRKKENFGNFDLNFTTLILTLIIYYCVGWGYAESYFTYFYRIKN